MVHPDLPQVIPLAPKFIRKQDGHTKQDCEITAGRRAIERIRSEYPHLSMILVADSLYTFAPTIRHLKGQRCLYLLVAKPGDHNSLFEDIDGLRRGGMLDQWECKEESGRRHVYEWANQIPLNADLKSPEVKFVQLAIFNDEGIQTFR